MSKRHQKLKRARHLRRQHRCQHPGCTNEGLACFCPDNETHQPEEWFCGEHCHEHGYCRGCGQFWAGVNSFDFNPSGLCEHCQSEANLDEADLEAEDDSYPYPIP